jgi:hypothetical protein
MGSALPCYRPARLWVAKFRIRKPKGTDRAQTWVKLPGDLVLRKPRWQLCRWQFSQKQSA